MLLAYDHSMKDATLPSKKAHKNGDTATLQSLVLNVTESAVNKDHITAVILLAKDKEGRSLDVTDRAIWHITPPKALKIEGHTLTALKDGNVTLQAEYEGLRSDPVTLTIYWEVDGHRLPPEPDPKINNATLLGIDVNHNGIQDDVERWIYEKYDHPIKRGILMQNARAYNKVIVDPSRAKETMKYADKSLSCEFYWIYIKKPTPLNKYDHYNHIKKLKRQQFNTVDRLNRYHKI